jgi:hypothetical protein
MKKYTAKYTVKNKRLWNTRPYKGCVHQILPLRDQSTLCKRRQKECESHRGGRTPSKQSLLNQHDPRSHEPTELKQLAQGLQWVCSSSSRIYYSLKFVLFMVVLGVRMTRSLSCALSWTLFLLCLFCPIPMCWVLFYLTSFLYFILFYFILFYFILLWSLINLLVF